MRLFHPYESAGPGGRRLFPRTLGALFLAAASLQLWAACDKKAVSADPKVRDGRAVYISYCISCHNINPAIDGSLGPAVKGSSLDLLQARVIRGEYPAGYSPKRPSKIMQKLPLTEANVEVLHAFLSAP